MPDHFPTLRYSRNRLRRLCRRLVLTEPAVAVSGRRPIIHDLHTNWIPAGRVINEHTHSFYEAHIVLAGHAALAQPNTVPVSTGMTLLLAPQTPHAWVTDEDDSFTSFVLWFTLERPLAELAPLRWAMLPNLLWVVDLLLEETQEGQAGWAERASAYLTVLFSRVLALTRGGQAPSQDADADTQLEALIDQFLWDNLQRPLTVAEVAAHVGMSERNLYRKFRALTGETIMERLLNLRIQRAQTLLEESDAPLAEIGQQVGIADPAYFCRCFKSYVHTTPHKYRLYLRA